jgi:hypothetical protein
LRYVGEVPDALSDSFFIRPELDLALPSSRICSEAGEVGEAMLVSKSRAARKSIGSRERIDTSYYC